MYSMSYDILWGDPTKGSISLTNAKTMFYGVKSERIELQAGNITSADSTMFSTGNYLKHLLLIDMHISFYIQTSSGLVGTAIDELADSVADMTGQTSPTVTMTTTQYGTITPSIWNNKNWTIAQV
jgi:hypothetical protein